MENFDDKDIATLLRLKRHEQPPAGYYESFLHEFHRRQRAELLKQPLWRIALQRAQDFMFRFNVSTLGSYQAFAAAIVVFAAVLSLRVYEAPQAATVASVTSEHASALPVADSSQAAAWSLSSTPVITRDFGSTPIRSSNFNAQTHRLAAAPPHYVLDSTPVSYEPASFRF
jgi:predicted nucleic acid-binding protein